MGLFDDKEDVLDIQLTQYGKKMLALGKLAPAFYAFCDDDILYDATHGSVTENQNDAQTRILSTSVSRKAQALFYGIETEYKRDRAQLRKGEVFLNERQPEADKTYNSISVLGSSQVNNQFSPAWQLYVSSAEISSSLVGISGSISDLRIPQINLKDVVYDVNYIRGLPEDLQDQLETQNFESMVLENEMKKLANGSLIEVVNKDIFINLEEVNSILRNDTFEVEIFLVESKSTNATQTTEVLTPLFFKQKSFKRDDIYDDEEYFQQSVVGEVDSSMVEYYMNVESDYEIPTDVLCRYVTEDRRKGIYGKYLVCTPKSIVLRNPYSSDAADGGSTPGEEPCDD